MPEIMSLAAAFVVVLIILLMVFFDAHRKSEAELERVRERLWQHQHELVKGLMGELEDRSRMHRDAIELLMKLRSDGERAGPAAFDEQWGRYTMGELEAEAEQAAESDLSDQLRQEFQKGL